MSKFSFKNLFTVSDDYDDDYYDDYEDDYEEPVKEKKSKKAADDDDAPKASAKRVAPSRKIVPMKKNSSGEVRVIKPTSYDEAREVVDILLSGRIVFLNLEGLHMELAQRIIDFISGATYSVSGNLEKISSGYMYAVTPHNVDLSGDFAEMSADGYEINPYKRF